MLGVGEMNACHAAPAVVPSPAQRGKVSPMGRVAPDCSTRRRKGAAPRIYVARYASLAPSPDPPPPPMLHMVPLPRDVVAGEASTAGTRPLSPAHRLTPQHSQPSQAIFQQSIPAGLTQSYYLLTTSPTGALETNGWRCGGRG
jgi:hypothetical protein